MGGACKTVPKQHVSNVGRDEPVVKESGIAHSGRGAAVIEECGLFDPRRACPVRTHHHVIKDRTVLCCSNRRQPETGKIVMYFSMLFPFNHV